MTGAPNSSSAPFGSCLLYTSCRSFLTDWIDPATGEYKYEGRFNQGVCSINLPQDVYKRQPK